VQQVTDDCWFAGAREGQHACDGAARAWRAGPSVVAAKISDGCTRQAAELTNKTSMQTKAAEMESARLITP